MDTIECIKTRRCKRELGSGDVKKEIIENIIDCGRLAPTANNLQPCEFVVVTDRKKLLIISEIVGKNAPFLKDAAFCIIIFAKDVKYYLEDGCAATENILLAINNFHLSACWVAGAQKEYAFNVAKELNVPAGLKLISIIPVGYSNEQPNIQKRKLGEVIHYEKF
ncbi:MAG: nitroreductase family protein [Elusimicrobia bacterium CG06_land_8_20_14_3_00_38_11]|nr:MAG: nitroreductase family protein [Elusimicrobia bacterium CG06_land_8_20_14_3_00_38_11]